jgi:fermentation-respiration switch protein FrsA (DUF1100 family)
MQAPPTDPDPELNPGLGRPRGRRANGWRRWVVRIVRIPVFVYLGVALVLFSFQTRLIFPGAQSQGQATAEVRVRPSEELINLVTARGDQIVALFGPALAADGKPDPNAARRPTLLYFYGNGMCLRDTTYDEFERFRRLGLNVLVPEYVGYGMSHGKPSESACYATADAAYNYLRSRKDLGSGPIVVGGWSLGGSVALDLASRKPVAGLMVFSTFTSMIDMSRRNFPFLPASLLLRHRFDNLRKIARVDCPILIGHGRRDQLVPYVMSSRLADAARTQVTRLSIDTAGHNDFYAVGGDRVFDAVRTFVEQLPRSNRSPDEPPQRRSSSER